MRHVLALTAAVFIASAPLAFAQPLTEAQAKDTLQKDGYTDISEMKQDADGWHAKAKKDKVDVMVYLDDMDKIQQEIHR